MIAGEIVALKRTVANDSDLSVSVSTTVALYSLRPSQHYTLSGDHIQLTNKIIC